MGIIYSIIILLSCILGSIVGLGGGLFIRPIFDAIGYHNVLSISFFTSSAISSMAAVSTIKKIQDGTKIDIKIALIFSLGAITGGAIGNLVLEHLVYTFPIEAAVKQVQIVFTVLVLCTSLIVTAKSNIVYKVESRLFCVILGILLGIIAAFLGIGGGALNVPLFMIFFGLNIKDASAYSIVVIFFSHFSSLVTKGFTIGYGYFDLSILIFVIPAAALGGLIGAKFSKVFSEATVKKLFVGAVFAVIVLNVINGLFII